VLTPLELARRYHPDHEMLDALQKAGAHIYLVEVLVMRDVLHEYLAGSRGLIECLHASSVGAVLERAGPVSILMSHSASCSRGLSSRSVLELAMRSRGVAFAVVDADTEKQLRQLSSQYQAMPQERFQQ